MTITRIFRSGIAWGAVLFSTGIPAGDFLQINDDLDGDGKAEIVNVSVSGAGDFQKYTIRVGNSEFKGEFFAAEGDLPQLNLVRLIASRKDKQLLVSLTGPSSCYYEILSFHKGKLTRLLSHQSRACDKPQIAGNGIVEILTPEGFWKRRDKYSLSDDATKLIQVRRSTYPVEAIHISQGVAGVANKNLSLKPAGCKSASILSGSHLTVTEYDRATKQYLLKAEGGACGWIAESELSSSIDQLPWAG